MQLILVINCIVLTQNSLPTSDHRIWQPYGPYMCKNICQRRENCLTYIFDEVKLSCQLQWNLNGSRIFNHLKGNDVNLCDVTNAQPRSTSKRKTTDPPKLPGTNDSLQNDISCPKEHVESLHEACRKGFLGKVKGIISEGIVDINCPGTRGKTAIMFSINWDRIEIFDYLLEQKCDLTAVDDNTDTALHYSCERKNISFVKTLLNNFTININERGKFGRTPLMVAVQERRTNAVMFLRQRGAAFEMVDDFKNNVLHLACRTVNPDIVRYILSFNEIDIDGRGQYGRTPLMFAVKASFVPVVKLLIAKGADTKAIDENNCNILHIACMGYKKMVEYILSLNTTGLECLTKERRTPLMVAVEKIKLRIIKHLVSKGADIKALDAGKNNILHLACLTCYLKEVRYVLSLKGHDVESRGNFGRTPLMMSVQRGCTEVVKLLRGKKYKASLISTDDGGCNVLHIACSEGRLFTLKYLVTLKELKGFERAKNKAGKTPVQLAEMKGKCEVVKFLKAREKHQN